MPIDMPRPAPQKKFSPEDYDHAYVRELEKELGLTQEHLQDTIEELETSSEELQSLNEELQSSNEELQASNEELETSNEELQASNEELNTVNDELRAKSEEAAALLEDLEKSEKQYRLLVDNMNEALMVCELEFGPQKRPTDLIIRQANPALKRLIGIGDHEVPLRAGPAHLEELVTGDMLHRFLEIAHGGESQRFEVHLNDLEKHLTLSVYGLDDSRIGVVCRDDTQRKAAEEKIRVSEARYRELVQNANSAIIRWKSDGTLTFFNEFAESFFGYDADEVIGKSVAILLPEKDSSGGDLSALVRDIVAHPDNYASTVNENVRSDGSRVWMAWTNKPVFDERGEVKEILAVGSDITERKRAEETLEKLNASLEQQVAERTRQAEARTRQLQALSVELIEAEERERQRIAYLLHDDVQQLLAGARMQLESARQTLPDEPKLASAEYLMVESTEKVRDLSHELSPPVLKQGGCIPALQWLTKRMEEQFGLKVELKHHLGFEPKNALVNAFIFRAAQELLFNVVKHAGVETAEVELSSTEDQLIMVVSDNGRGFVCEATDKEPNGFGLLSLRERAASIGGDLDIGGEPGRGTRATLTAPLDILRAGESQSVETSAEQRPERAVDAAPSTDTTDVKILFADDHEMMRRGLIELVVGQFDIQVAGEADNGRKALELARRLRPDLVIMDVSMPEMDGVEATRRIKEELGQVRVIGFSMHDDGHIEEKMRAAGADDYVTKTASSTDLIQTISEMIGQSPRQVSSSMA